MKYFTIAFCLFISISFLSAQPGTTINYEDNLGPLTLSHNGLVNGKHSYTETSPDNVTISYSGTRWEITCTGCGVIFFSTEVTDSNPPSFAVGNWQDADLGDGTTLVGISGSGTTNIVPVELISFTGKIINEYVQLTWITASEFNNEKFEIEESFNGSAFHKIGEEKGNGSSSFVNDYSYTVTNPPSGLTYYRLKQMDYSGRYEFSEVISIKFNAKEREVGEFYPNPTRSGMVNLAYNSISDNDINVSVYNTTGQLVTAQLITASKGSNHLNMNFSELSAGFYIVKFGDDINTVSRNLIIQ